MRGLKVGDQILVVVSTRHRETGPKLYDYQVTKVGRVYFQAREVSTEERWGAGPKFRIDDGDCLDRTGNEAFLNREHFETEKQRRSRHERMSSLLSCRYILRPNRLTDAEVETVITLLEKAAGQTQEPLA